MINEVIYQIDEKVMWTSKLENYTNIFNPNRILKMYKNTVCTA